MILFYDSGEFDEEVMKLLTLRLLDIYVLKNEKLLMAGGNLNNLRNKKNVEVFEAVLPMVLENVLIDYVKSVFVDMNAENLMVPWIYLCFNKEFENQSIGPFGKVNAP